MAVLPFSRASLARSPLFAHIGHGVEGKPYLFFNANQHPRITANTKTAMLAAMWNEWTAQSPAQLQAALDTFEASGNIVSDFAKVLFAFERSLTVQRASAHRTAPHLAFWMRSNASSRAPTGIIFTGGGTEILGIRAGVIGGRSRLL